MDNTNPEEDKYADIRQTIRKVVLPLVQAIYDEDPSDIISFCHCYFDDLLKKRESSGKDTSDPVPECTGKIDNKMEKREEKPMSIDESKMADTSQLNIQGSASAPVLISDKHSEALSLKEASSWDVPSSHSQANGSCDVLDCNLVDAVCGIGDRPDSPIKHTGLENNTKEGDVLYNTLKTEKSFEDKRYVENKFVQKTENDSSKDAVQEEAFALLYKETEGNLKQESSEFKDEETAEIYDTFEMGGCNCGAYDQNNIERNEMEACRKQLSPNSSSGFIPHLAEGDLKEGMKKDFKRKPDEETEEISTTFSERVRLFNSLAQKLSSAEANFNDEFQNAEEISDVLQKREATNETSLRNECDEIQDRDSDSVNKKISEKEDATIKGYILDNIKDENNNLSLETNDQLYNLKEIIDSTKYEIPCEGRKYIAKKKTCIDFLKNTFPAENGSAKMEKTSGNEESASIKDNKKDEESKANCPEFHQTVDESWKRRWYQAHPLLENLGSSFQRTQARSHRPYRCNLAGNYRWPNSGEAGDVPPPDTFRAQRGTSDENLDYSSEVTNHESIVRESNEANRAGSRAKESRRSFDRVISSTNTPSMFPQNVPYSWRKMNKHQTRSPERDAQSVKESGKKSDEENVDSDSNIRGEKLHITDEAETLSEIIVVKENDKEITTETLNDNQNVTLSAMDEFNEQISKTLQYIEDFQEDIAGAEVTRDQSANTEIPRLQFSSKQDKPLSSNYEKQSKELWYESDDFMNDHGVNEMNEKPSNWKKYIIPEGCPEEEIGAFGQDAVPSDAKKNNSECHRVDSSVKVEPGLNSACGDFVSSRIDENDAQDINSQTIERDTEESETHLARQNYLNTGAGVISVEYFEEIIGRVVDQQREALKDNYEGLNFSSYSESDSSNIDSDFSEPDDFNLSNICEQ